MNAGDGGFARRGQFRKSKHPWRAVFRQLLNPRQAQHALDQIFQARAAFEHPFEAQLIFPDRTRADEARDCRVDLTMATDVFNSCAALLVKSRCCRNDSFRRARTVSMAAGQRRKFLREPGARRRPKIPVAHGDRAGAVSQFMQRVEAPPDTQNRKGVGNHQKQQACKPDITCEQQRQSLMIIHERRGINHRWSHSPGGPSSSSPSSSESMTGYDIAHDGGPIGRSIEDKIYMRVHGLGNLRRHGLPPGRSCDQASILSSNLVQVFVMHLRSTVAAGDWHRTSGT